MILYTSLYIYLPSSCPLYSNIYFLHQSHSKDYLKPNKAASMASTEKAVPESGKAGPESHFTDQSRCINLFLMDLSLRLLLFASTVVAIVLIATSKETELVILSPLRPIRVPRTAKFNHSPALIYFLVAVCAACLYSVISTLVSLGAVSKRAPSKGILLFLAFFDALLLGIVASALGAATSVAYVGLKGNSHVGWGKVCNVYDKFCKFAAGYLVMGLLASVLLVFLLFLSTFSLYKRSH